MHRRRVELLQPGLPNQPSHHEALELPADSAQALVERVNSSAEVFARRALLTLRDELEQVTLTAFSIRTEPDAPISETVAEVLSSRAATYAADGELYRRALCQAAEMLSMEVTKRTRRPSSSLAAQTLGVTEIALAGLLDQTGRRLGSPWQKEHRTGVSFALASLSAHEEIILPD